MNTPSEISTDFIQDLEFIRISDEIRPNKWVEWEVRFVYEGYPCEGFLGGCPNRPNLHHDDVIESAERI